jgi:hypothetical protein
MILLGIGGHRSGKLEFVYLLMATFAIRPPRQSVAFIVDDENSRNASDTGGDSRQEPRDPPRAAIRGVTAERRGRHGYDGDDTARGRLFERYDRERRRSEEQIGSRMLLGAPEARDQWYELRKGDL